MSTCEQTKEERERMKNKDVPSPRQVARRKFVQDEFDRVYNSFNEEQRGTYDWLAYKYDRDTARLENTLKRKREKLALTRARSGTLGFILGITWICIFALMAIVAVLAWRVRGYKCQWTTKE
ncbi:hypothetical protein BKA67DRAFT_533199 [Truncatella angustata]|uniref:Uncharacterized protein n=1 Tax=Truncatella angustata TaxID=152316 RepID=A0A9P9A1F1_9PEZI|nr:uncharacterized protein BKA67DRAFT_533199 [Truncatella angustata]KAH6658024.1 hypothetical protein BKA67DRAFT_533199 [Truncatella angustata]